MGGKREHNQKSKNIDHDIKKMKKKKESEGKIKKEDHMHDQKKAEKKKNKKKKEKQNKTKTPQKKLETGINKFATIVTQANDKKHNEAPVTEDLGPIGNLIKYLVESNTFTK